MSPDFNVATNSMANATYFKMVPGAASRYLRPAGGGNSFLLASARFNTRATHIQCCPGQPRTAAADHPRSPANRVRSATASGYVDLRLAQDEFRGKEIKLIEAAFSGFPAGIRR